MNTDQEIANIAKIADIAKIVKSPTPEARGTEEADSGVKI